MAPKWHAIAATFQLMRIGLAGTAVSSLWLIVLLSHGLGDRVGVPVRVLGLSDAASLWVELALSVGIAVGLSVFGVVLNDLLDTRRDRTFEPDRPLPARNLSPATALVVGIAGLIIAALCSVAFGTVSTILCLLCAGGLVFYNTLGRYLPAVGLASLGLIGAAQMFIPNPQLAFAWPVWLLMSHVMFVGAWAYRLQHKRPTITAAGGWGLAAAWVFWSLALIGLMLIRDAWEVPTVRPWAPLIAAVTFIGLAIRQVQRRGGRRDAGAALERLGMVWLIVYDIAWLTSAELIWQAGVVALLLPIAWVAMKATPYVAPLLGGDARFQYDQSAE